MAISYKLNGSYVWNLNSGTQIKWHNANIAPNDRSWLEITVAFSVMYSTLLDFPMASDHVSLFGFWIGAFFAQPPPPFFFSNVFRLSLPSITERNKLKIQNITKLRP